MSKKESFCVGYNNEEINKIENAFYCLQFGGDFVAEDGCYLFTRAEISKLYNRTLKNLVDIIYDGSEKDSKYALNLVPGLIIRQMRFH